MDSHVILSVFVNLALLAAAVAYAGLVSVRYLTYGPGIRPQIDLRRPGRSAEHLAVWLGAKGLAFAVRATTRIFEMLSEASAEVGDWFLNHVHSESH